MPDLKRYGDPAVDYELPQHEEGFVVLYDDVAGSDLFVLAAAMEQMLKHNCSNPAWRTPWLPNVNVYTFEGHCVEYDVYAIPLGNGHYKVLHMEVKS